MQRSPSDLSPASCRAARGLAHLTQAELAGLAGVSISTLRRFEQGETIRRAPLIRIFDALTAQQLVFIASAPEPADR